MRVVITTDAIGGVWQYATTLAATLAEEHNVHVMLVVCGKPPSLEQLRALQIGPRPKGGAIELEHLDVPLEWECASYRTYDAARHQLLDLALRWRAHVLHANEHYLGEIGSSGMPVVVVSHSDLCSWRAYVLGEQDPQVDPAYVHRVKAGLSAAASVVAPSMLVADALHRWLGHSGVVRIIPNGVTQQPDGLSPARTIDAIMAGRLWDPAKNVKVFRDAVANLPSFVCVAAGDTVAPDGSSAPTEGANLQLLGRLPNKELRHTLARARLFVSPALYDPFGLVAVEAAFAGCCLILSDIPSYRAIWEDTALYVDPGDADALCETIRSVLADPERQDMFAAQAAARARALYAAERMAADYLATYQRLALRYGLAT